MPEKSPQTQKPPLTFHEMAALQNLLFSSLFFGFLHRTTTTQPLHNMLLAHEKSHTAKKLPASFCK
jgi:hypothetical protein